MNEDLRIAPWRRVAGAVVVVASVRDSSRIAWDGVERRGKEVVREPARRGGGDDDFCVLSTVHQIEVQHWDSVRADRQVSPRAWCCSFSALRSSVRSCPSASLSLFPSSFLATERRKGREKLVKRGWKTEGLNYLPFQD